MLIIECWKFIHGSWSCFTVRFFWPADHLAPCWGSLCSLLHPLCAWPALRVYTTTLFISCFSHFQHNWEIVLGTPCQQTEMSHLYCHGKQSRCWKYLFPVAVVGWVHPSPPTTSHCLPPFMSSALCSRDSKHFPTCSYGKCDIHKKNHLFICAFHLGLCVMWCPWVRGWVADIANMMIKSC